MVIAPRVVSSILAIVASRPGGATLNDIIAAFAETPPRRPAQRWVSTMVDLGHSSADTMIAPYRYRVTNSVAKDVAMAKGGGTAKGVATAKSVAMAKVGKSTSELPHRSKKKRATALAEPSVADVLTPLADMATGRSANPMAMATALARVLGHGDSLAAYRPPMAYRCAGHDRRHRLVGHGQASVASHQVCFRGHGRGQAQVGLLLLAVVLLAVGAGAWYWDGQRYPSDAAVRDYCQRSRGIDPPSLVED
jgi:hypothetical protein